MEKKCQRHDDFFFGAPRCPDKCRLCFLSRLPVVGLGIFSTAPCLCNASLSFCSRDALLSSSCVIIVRLLIKGSTFLATHPWSQSSKGTSLLPKVEEYFFFFM